MSDTARSSSPALVFWEWLVLAYGAGIFLVRYPLPTLVASLLLAWLFASGGRFRRAWVLLLLCMAVGYAHTHLRLPEPPAQMPVFIEERAKAALSGEVDEVIAKPGERLEIRLDNVRWSAGGESGVLPGRLAWTWDKAVQRPSPGDRVTFPSVRVKPVRGFVNPGIWSYRFYRRLQGIFFRAYTRSDEKQILLTNSGRGFPENLRQRFRSVIGRHAPAEGAGRGLPAALAMGDRFDLSPETVTLFRRASLAHSLALSGMHLGFVASLGFALAWLAGYSRPGIFLHIPRLKLGVAFAAPLVLFYVWLGGFSPSLVRSAIMFASFGTMLILGRGRVLVDGLFAALVLILVWNPLAAYDIRLQFSAMAVAGIMVIFPIGWRYAHRISDAARQRFSGPGPAGRAGPAARAAGFIIRSAAAILLVSVCANLALMPLIVWNFGSVSVNPLPNVFWLPLMGILILPLSLAGMVLGAVPAIEPLGGAMLHTAGTLSSWAVNVIGRAADAGVIGETVPLRPQWPLVLGYYAVIAGAAMYMQRGCIRKASAVLGLGMVLALMPGILRDNPLPGSRLTVTALDTGQSQALVLEFPGGSRALVDGGGTWSGSFDMGRAITAPYLTSNRPPVLDYMIMTHPHLDHSRGLMFPLKHFRVERFAHNGRLPDGREMADALAAYGREPEVWRAGQSLEAGKGTVMEVLHPDGDFQASGENDPSLTLRVVWRGRGMALLPGDIEEAGTRALLDSGRDLTARVLILPHHGGSNELTAELLERVRPELAVACAGHLNYRRLPHFEVRAALAEAGIPLLVTGENGMVSVSWNSPDSEPVIYSALDRVP